MLFTLHAPRLDDLISVAERGEVMEREDHYGKPKPRTGVFLQEAVSVVGTGRARSPRVLTHCVT